MEIKNCERLGEGKGLFATIFYPSGSIVHTLDGICLNKPTQLSIHIGNNLHIEDKWGIFINHSFDPTVYISGKNIVAKKDINAGDEITFDYNSSEICMAAPFYDGDKYVCGSAENLL